MKSKHCIILFDSQCLVCNFFVRFLLKRDKKGRFLFSSIEGQWFQEHKQEFELSNVGDTLMVLCHGKLYTYSSAVFIIIKYLPFPWKLLYVFILIPRVLRDALYKFFAKYRHVFHTNSCMLLSAKDKERFI